MEIVKLKIQDKSYKIKYSLSLYPFPHTKLDRKEIKI